MILGYGTETLNMLGWTGFERLLHLHYQCRYECPVAVEPAHREANGIKVFHSGL